MEVRIKNIGVKSGTVGWLKNQLESGELILEESNSYYIPIWDQACDWSRGTDKIVTHGLVLREKNKADGALIAYRGIDGEYVYNVNSAIGIEPYAHLKMLLTEAAVKALEQVCLLWIAEQKSEEPEEEPEIEIKIKIERATPLL